MDIVVWNENVHESRGDATVLSHYPDGIHAVVASPRPTSSTGGATSRTARCPTRSSRA
jgi:trehalose utilization protein